MRKLIFNPVWSLIVLATLLLIQYNNTPFIESLKLRYFDQLIINQEPVHNNIYTVNIDEAALEQNGQWPWPRSQYADLIEDLYARGAGLVIFNVLMPDPDRAGKDHVLIETLEYYPVITTVVGAEQGRNTPVNPGAAVINSQYSHLIINYGGIIANAEGIDQAALGTGIANTLPEIDGVTRRVPLVISSNGVLYPAVTLEILRVIAGDPNFQIRLSPLGVDRLRIPQFGELSTDELGRVWIDWSQQSRSVSAADLPDDFGGAVVFVSPTAAGLNNPVPTAAGSVWPHQVQAALLGTVFNDSNIQRPAWAAGAELLALAVAGLLLILLSRWIWVGIVFFVVAVGSTIGGSIYLFSAYNYLTDGLTVAAFLLIVGLVRYVIKFADEFLQKQAIKKQFAGYASAEVVEILQKNPELVKQGVKKEVSILFSDLRGFTPLGESFGDDVAGLTKIMNGYMDAITQPVLNNKGMIIKYIGDASMHIHNAPIEDEDHAETAVRTGLQMLKAVEKFNQEVIIPQGRPPVGMGAGINTGLGYIGEMGSSQRHSYDVLGDAVSTAARIESKCKEYGCLLLIGGETVNRCKEGFFFLKIDDLAVKGKTVGIAIYTVLDQVDSSYIVSRRLHNKMHEQYRSQDFKGAIKTLAQLRGEFDGKMDNYYDMWEERCNYMLTQNLPESWDGIFIAQTK